MSLVLALVNLLPVLPLDGGRAMEAVAYQRPGVLCAVHKLTLGALTLCGAWCLLAGWGWAPLLFAFWLITAPKLRSGL